MRIFVTGATGYIGLAVACAFRKAGHIVKGVVRSEKSAALLQMHEIDPIFGDIGEPKSYLTAAKEADILIHCASEMSPERVQKDRTTIETFIASSQHGSHAKTFIYTSGCWIYGNTHGRLVDESTPDNPLSIVTWRPVHEELVRKAESANLRCVILRPGCVYGGTGGGVASEWFASATEGEVVVFGDGENHLTTIHLDDLGQAYLLAAEKKIGGVTLNVNDGSLFTVKQMASAVAEAAGIPKKMKFLSLEETLQRFGAHAIGPTTDQKIDASRIRKLLGWQPRHPNFPSEAARYFASWRSSRA